MWWRDQGVRNAAAANGLAKLIQQTDPYEIQTQHAQIDSDRKRGI